MSGIGIDAGSTYTKYCVLGDDAQIRTVFSGPTPIRQKEYFTEKLQALWEAYGEIPAVSCGYGRKNIAGTRAVSELSALAAGTGRVLPEAEVVLDIGGQDTKLIRQREGKLLSFFVNDRCAAGCGMFLGNTLHRLGVAFETLDLTDGRLPGIRLSSTCAVFAQSEIVERIAEGVPEEEILRAVLVQMLTQSKALLDKVDCGRVWLSGGLTGIPGIAAYAGAVLERPVAVPEHAAYLAALGCALMASGGTEKGREGEKG